MKRYYIIALAFISAVTIPGYAQKPAVPAPANAPAKGSAPVRGNVAPAPSLEKPVDTKVQSEELSV